MMKEKPTYQMLHKISKAIDAKMPHLEAFMRVVTWLHQIKTTIKSNEINLAQKQDLVGWRSAGVVISAGGLREPGYNVQAETTIQITG